MSAKIIDGKKIAAAMRGRIAEETDELAAGGLLPGLGVILVGEDPASISYVTAKEKACRTAGIHSREIRLPAETAQGDLLRHIAALNADSAIHGILVQLPLPAHIDENAVVEAIDPSKDVDGFHPVSLGRMLLGRETFLPCTPHGILQLLMQCEIPTRGKHAVIVGRSNIVGRPLANLMSQKRPGGNATVTVCHTATPDLGAVTRQADILVVAAGRPNTVSGDMIRPGCAVIDVGVNRVPDSGRTRGYRLCGDVDFDSVAEKAGWITPVPGGVGPMTITMLLHNTLAAARLRRESPK